MDEVIVRDFVPATRVREVHRDLRFRSVIARDFGEDTESPIFVRSRETREAKFRRIRDKRVGSYETRRQLAVWCLPSISRNRERTRMGSEVLAHSDVIRGRAFDQEAQKFLRLRIMIESRLIAGGIAQDSVLIEVSRAVLIDAREREFRRNLTEVEVQIQALAGRDFSVASILANDDVDARGVRQW